MPSTPLDVQVLKASGTSARLRWTEPRAPNGIIQGYQLTLLDTANNVTDTRTLADMTQPSVEHTLSDLAPLTYYKVQVQAYTRKYQGDLSAPVRFRTDVAAPSAPNNVSVQCLAADSMLVQWQRPEKYTNQIDFYYVLYRPDSAWRDEEATFSATKRDKPLNELLITNLTADTLYELKVLAGTKSVLEPSLVYKSEPSATLRVLLQPNCEGKCVHWWRHLLLCNLLPLAPTEGARSALCVRSVEMVDERTSKGD